MAFRHPKYGLITPAPDTRVNKLGHELKQLGESLENIIAGVDQRATAAQSATGKAAQRAAASAAAVSGAAAVIRQTAQTAQTKAEEAAQQAQQAQQAAQQVATATENIDSYITSKVSTIAAATTGRQGIARLATQQDVSLGTSTDKIVTPAALKNGAQLAATQITSGVLHPARVPYANTTTRGGVVFATQAEVNAGTVTNKVVTPAAVKQRAQPTLWDGVSELRQHQSITLSEPISQQATGVVLVFAGKVNGQVKNFDYQTQFIPRALLVGQPPHEYTFRLYSADAQFNKIVQIENTRVTGTFHNNAAGTERFALVKVYGI